MLRLAIIAALLPSVALAASLDLPSNATQTFGHQSGAGSLRIPLGPFSDAGLQSEEKTGTVQRQAWRVDAAGVTTIQLIDPLKAQLSEQGYDIVFECRDLDCGGFDFRFALNVVSSPDMFVDLGDFRFLSAKKGEDAVTLLASRTTSSGYLQVSQVSKDAPKAPLSAPTAQSVRKATVTPEAALPLAQALETDGFAELGDLSFQTGSSSLSEGPFASLETLAAFLASNPNRTVALVGHTDSEGSLDGNIALSKRRAGSVLERLVSKYSVPRKQLDAQGMGYLRPIATNLTEEGRERNRRVEVIITSTN